VRGSRGSAGLASCPSIIGASPLGLTEEHALIASPEILDSTRLRVAFAPTVTAVRTGALPAAIVGVSDGRATLALEAFPGPHHRRLGSDGIFFLASITKPIVATAVMQLVDAGLVDLHAPIGRYVPAFVGPGKDRVTAWHVLTHTAGIQDIETDYIRRKRPSAAEMLRIVCTSPLRFEPGTRYEYCSDSFYLLSELISAARRAPFPTALRTALLDPLGMPDTSFDPRHARSRLVPVHGIPLGNRLMRELILRYLAKAALPGGGLWSTAADLLAFGRALLASARGDGGPLSRPALELMTAEQTAGILEVAADGTTRDPRYALGWGKPRPDGTVPAAVAATDGSSGMLTAPITVPASASAFTHGGASGTRLWIDPERDLVFVFLTNLWGVDDSVMYATLAEVYAVIDRGR
jgi:serine-type D-Ala-D-Ala carboxypeptidase